MHRILALLLFLLTQVAVAQPMADRLYSGGREAYQKGDYATAVSLLERAANLAPARADLQHWLGRAYGRLAEHSGWLQAITLARKARAALERSVTLDPRDREALEDLIEYYRQAPAFLGGSQEKADALAQRLARLPP